MPDAVNIGQRYWNFFAVRNIYSSDSCHKINLTLPLLMLRIFASNKNSATPSDDFAAGASWFYGSSYSHIYYNLLIIRPRASSYLLNSTITLSPTSPFLLLM